MKKKLLVLLTVLLIGTIYINVITRIYVNVQAMSICTWLNSDITTGKKPSVGPWAFEHLSEMKSKKKNTFVCSIVASPTHTGYNFEKAILIREGSISEIYLIYGLGLNGRFSLFPTYYQHSTVGESDVNHHKSKH